MIDAIVAGCWIVGVTNLVGIVIIGVLRNRLGNGMYNRSDK